MLSVFYLSILSKEWHSDIILVIFAASLYDARIFFSVISLLEISGKHWTLTLMHFLTQQHYVYVDIIVYLYITWSNICILVCPISRSPSLLNFLCGSRFCLYAFFKADFVWIDAREQTGALVATEAEFCHLLLPLS